MKDDQSKQSRTERKTRADKKDQPKSRFDKYYYIIVAVLLIILLVIMAYIFFLPRNERSNLSESTQPKTEIPAENKNETEETNQNEADNAAEETQDDSEDTTDSEEPTEDESETTELAEVESDDPLVEEAYTGNWSPVGTSQTGEHTTDFSDGSQDRSEINEAVRSVTGLSSGNMTEWWVGGNGPSQVEVTVSNNEQSEVYRVYLQFVEDEGWQPTKVEELSSVPSQYQ
ncbi:YrrS family protein [Marinilactibacillus kalidii]|uniref:YrrS family protein n=1 Tax=Marinilactibacillus kalidii TaxID=2820274 RepID=UPI001ABE0E49|nr:YrrS family protein [Marinilactibacillus kalidii]